MSGGSFAVQVRVCPCCSRTALLVTARLPKRACSSAAIAAIVASPGRNRGIEVGAFMSGPVPGLGPSYQRMAHANTRRGGNDHRRAQP